jgi:hypothetical protein
VRKALAGCHDTWGKPFSSKDVSHLIIWKLFLPAHLGFQSYRYKDVKYVPFADQSNLTDRVMLSLFQTRQGSSLVERREQ